MGNEVVPLFAVSFIIFFSSLIFLVPVSMDIAREDLYYAFFSPTTILFMGGFVLSRLLSKYRLDEYFSKLALKRFEGNNEKLLLALMLSAAFLSLWISNTATAAMMLAIVGPLYRQIPRGK